MALRLASILLAALCTGAFAPTALAAKAAPAKKAKKAKAKPSQAEETARETLIGCEQKYISGGVLFQCERLVVTVTDKSDAPEVLGEATLGMIRRLGGQLETNDATIEVNGKKLPGKSFEILTPESKATQHLGGRLISFAVKPGTSRAVLCFSSKPTETSEYRCTKLFDALGTVGPAPFLAEVKPPEEPAFLGRKVAVPDGCKTASADAGSFRIDCGLASIFYAKAQTIEAANAIADAFRQSYLEKGSTAPDRPCILGGTKTTCRVVDGQGRTFYIATATVGSQAVLGVCYQEPDRVEVHPVCQDVFSF